MSSGVGLTLLAAGAWAQQPLAAGEPRLPNVVVILADDLGFGDISAFDSAAISTPRIDQLAAEGMKLNEFYAPSSVCSPSRAGLLTGRHAVRLGIDHVFMYNAHDGMDASEITIAEQLKSVGYQTGMVGKWHLGHLDRYMPWNQGFNEFYGVPFSNDMSNLFFYENQKIIHKPIDQRYLTRRYTEKATDFIERHQETPFFLYVAHSMPHVPLYVSPKFDGKTGRGLYSDVVAELDWSTGEIVDKLDDLNLLNNTLVIFSSDNGPWTVMGDHGGSAGTLRSGKGSTFEGGQRVPTVAHWPAQIAAGSNNHSVSSLLDILPTLSDLAGVAIPSDRTIDGKSLAPIFSGMGERENQKFFYIASRGRSTVRGLRDGDWKLKRAQKGYPEFLESFLQFGKHGHPALLFNLNDDPEEQYNLAAQFPERVAAMEAQIVTFEQDITADKPLRKYMSSTKADRTGYGGLIGKGVFILLSTLLLIYGVYRLLKVAIKRIWSKLGR